MPKKTLDGSCPYCGGRNYDSAATEERKGGDQQAMYCLDCAQWSIRAATGRQYPLQDPTDKNDLPAIVTPG